MENRGDCTILVVDDDPTIRTMLTAYLEDEGFKTRTASAGIQALGLIRAFRPDLVVLDVTMPGPMDGFRVLQTVRALPDPALAQTPIIFLTAIANAGFVRMALDHGVTDYMVKPFKLRELTARVVNALSAHQTTSAQWVLHYQPQVAVPTGELVGVEALLRVRHPERGLLSPDQFIDAAEHTGQITVITSWVLNAALAQRRAWASILAPSTRLSVNISAADLGELAFPGQVAESLAGNHAAPAQLRLEVAERMLQADPAQAQVTLGILTELGVELAIDNYGTGYSNLAYLASLKIGTVKIDRAFVQDMTRHAVHAAIVASTVALGHHLGALVVAEGVEDAGTWEALTALGCDIVQGYYLTQPLPPGDLERWIRAR